MRQAVKVAADIVVCEVVCSVGRGGAWQDWLWPSQLHHRAYLRASPKRLYWHLTVLRVSRAVLVRIGAKLHPHR